MSWSTSESTGHHLTSCVYLAQSDGGILKVVNRPTALRYFLEEYFMDCYEICTRKRALFSFFAPKVANTGVEKTANLPLYLQSTCSST